jgi:hypothetical protein
MAGVRVAHLARSCARFLGRVPLVPADRLSADAAAAVSRCERAVAELLRTAADVLVGYAAGAHGAQDALGSGCEQFVADSQVLEQGLDGDPALGLLRDVFADVVADAAKVLPLSAEPPSATAGTVVAAAPSRRSSPSVPSTRAARRTRATMTPQRRRPAWQPPAEPES